MKSNGTRLFLFGSATHSDKPRDVDILVVYEPALGPGGALGFRNKLIRRLGKHIAIPIHVVLLSEHEEQEVQFHQVREMPSIDTKGYSSTSTINRLTKKLNACMLVFGEPPIRKKCQGIDFNGEHR